MAYEISLAVQLNFNKGGASVAASKNGIFDVTGDRYNAKVLNIGNVAELIALDDMTTVGFVLIKNLDATNFITVGDDGTNFPVKILPEEFALFRLNANTLYMIADTAACEVEVTMVEE
ncbi:MAG: hypothetical protein ACO3PR_00030 [Limisphaerales bacterium]